MKRIMLMVLILIAIITALIIPFLNRADFHGEIWGIEESKFVLYPININPTEQYDVPEIHFSKDTEVAGKIKSIVNLKKGQEVKLWVEVIEGQKVASKIKVIKE
ncbi:hypothetical protein MKZ26_03095 [Sporosarcina sp. FSL K6-6792]|uniref:hypothetical protein n=1 Tax=Sporosarcina sp. FSL K6-6792 TaxID=2921559 RepID=UPI0030F51ED6